MEKQVETKEEKLARARLMLETAKEKGMFYALPTLTKLIETIEAE